MKTLLTLMLFLAGAGPSVYAQGAQTTEPRSIFLRFAPAPGDYLRINWSETDTDTLPPTAAPSASEDPMEKLKAALAPQKQTITEKEVGFDWNVQDRDTEGNSVIIVAYTFVRVRVTQGREVTTSLTEFGRQEVVNPGTAFVIDTEQEISDSNPVLGVLNKRPVSQQPPGVSKIVANLEFARAILNKTLIAQPFTIVVSPQGTVLSVRGMDRIMDRYQDEMKARKAEFAEQAQLNALIEAFFGEDTVTRTMTLSLLLPYPKQAVHTGESWSDVHEFELSGLKMPVKRTMRLDDLPGADGSVPLSGLIEMEFPKQKGRLVIEARQQSASVHADVDVATGMYRNLTSAGGIEILAHDTNSDATAKPEFYLSSRISSTAIVKRIGRRDPDNSKLLLWDGGNGAYHLRLGPDWKPGAVNEPVASMLFTVYRNDSNRAELITSVKLPSQEYEEQHPLDSAAERLKSQFESKEHAKVIISWNKLLSTESVRWVRYRMEITDPDGEQRTYWAQLGYGLKGQYTFELTVPGTSSTGFDSEVIGILESIGMAKAANSP